MLCRCGSLGSPRIQILAARGACNLKLRMDCGELNLAGRQKGGKKRQLKYLMDQLSKREKGLRV
ncbi:unnamed protein product [Larinioides sclopetarius]|uniref:Uncharacterized protein n=1 Tax=Larinioides sclopetarius TaxID=280406 RepID=A0AAV2BPN0_9ARAC